MFKYMSSEVAPSFAKTLKVRFTQPSELNDPFELRPLIDFKATAEELRDEVNARIASMFGNIDDVLGMVEKQLADHPKFANLPVIFEFFRKMIAKNPVLGQQLMAAMRQHKSEALDAMMSVAVWEALWAQIQKTLGNLVGIFSLSADPVNRLMWSHYASQHSGVVVEFDKDDPWFKQKATPSDEFRHLVQVTYVQNPAPRTWKQLNGVDMLYTKNADWAYEREWRIVRPLKDGTEVIPGKFCFDVPPSAIRSIIFGCRTSPALEKEIRDSVAANLALGHVRFKRAKLVGNGIEVVDANS